MISNSTARLAGMVALTAALAAVTTAPRPAAAQTSGKKPSVVLPQKTKTSPVAAKPTLPPTVLARVNGKDISRDDLLGLLDMVHGRPLIGELIKDMVISDEAKRLGVVVTPAELNDAISKAKIQIVASQQAQAKPQSYEAFAAENGITDDFLRWSLYEETLRKKTLTKVLTANLPTMDAQLKFAHILILVGNLPGDTSAKPLTEAEQQKADADGLAKIKEIQADIKAGKITFEDAAKKYSGDQSNASTGGLLPFANRGMFDPQFEGAAWNLKKDGDISEPVKSQYGWHLIKLVEKGTEASPAEKKAYHDKLMQQVNQQVDDPRQGAMQQWTSQLMSQAKVTVNPHPQIVPNAKSPLKSMNVPPK